MKNLIAGLWRRLTGSGSGSGGRGVVDTGPGRAGWTALGFQSYRTSVHDGNLATGGSGSLHMRYQRAQLVDQARGFMRDNPLFVRMIEGATSYIVGQGFGLQARSKNVEWNRQVEALWRDFWARPTVDGETSGCELESLVCRELLSVGDVGVLLTGLGRIQVFESEQIRAQDQAIEGVQVDAVTQRITGYWVSPYRNGIVDTSSAKPYPVAEFKYIGKLVRPSDRRAVPPCQSEFAMLHRIHDTCDSEALAFQLQSRLALSITRAGGANVATKISKRDPLKSNADGQAAQRFTEFTAGLIVNGEVGEEIKAIERNIPGANFPASITMFIRLLGMALGVPLEVILLDWTKSNYSQSRAVLEQAYATFSGWQKLLEAKFYRPVYEWFVDRCVAAKLVAKQPDQHAHEWIKPSYPWIDQLQEAEAKGAMLDRGFLTLSQVHKSLGHDREEFLKIREREALDAIEIQKRIKEKTGVDVPYEIFFGLEHSVNKPAQEDKDDRGGKSEAEREEREERAAAGGAPVSVVVRLPKGPVKTVTKVLTRDDKSRSETFEQVHTYDPNDQGSISTTAVAPIAPGPAVALSTRNPGEVA